MVALVRPAASVSWKSDDEFPLALSESTFSPFSIVRSSAETSSSLVGEGDLLEIEVAGVGTSKWDGSGGEDPYVSVLSPGLGFRVDPSSSPMIEDPSSSEEKGRGPEPGSRPPC